ncbi:Uncharacterized protein TCM_016043 [Theobroma cacao]|uniref:Uncharacterized protein n=1 Tax=Theobroma cacao TaxID=3641 RepID=A0A061G3J9_THECC|nr:Uncharacterized protein TCM_016043 [Theobroma cacao]
MVVFGVYRLISFFFFGYELMRSFSYIKSSIKTHSIEKEREMASLHFSIAALFLILIQFHVSTLLNSCKAARKILSTETNTEFIRTSCGATTYPDLCCTTFSSAMHPKSKPAPRSRSRLTPHVLLQQRSYRTLQKPAAKAQIDCSHA